MPLRLSADNSKHAQTYPKRSSHLFCFGLGFVLLCMPSTWSSIFFFIMDGIKWKPGPQTFPILYIRLYHMQFQIFKLFNRQNMPVYSLFYFWPKKILKCFRILPSLGFPHLWPEATLIDAQTLDLNSYLHKPNSFHSIRTHIHGR